ncbi:hypothetical protein LEP1GSC109_3506 [Leptospira interrogans str. UI 13372]|uniref:Uncharacterized protein n=2 Tax=Leptospira interrogans TaxID=173 RepID=A0A0E2DAC1_LEPIR|nr:hypothetical protein LEP1GSC104_3938 [Leptospira interrogans str. UI 12621]EKR57011.1 hypothetical protein LEP1GSC105_4925 [Leptospira interrogans str. UI 12758]EMN72205.1 hypothetical protein LEP1GSC100_1986 [Leptospira interrogans serovar Bataviae str. UI 08561]EMN79370.1 hypothetical protein LEP1GSC106_0468 [Leptospira interrogans serovar Grippotyphosa str. UI 12764]EMO00785.1 hypothetical protein LEP1GSC112_4392 [Leptospira interrogans serovar Pomona str. UT364]EMO92563.1 hypothetical p
MSFVQSFFLTLITAKERSFFLHPLIQKLFFFRKLNSGFLKVVPG